MVSGVQKNGGWDWFPEHDMAGNLQIGQIIVRLLQNLFWGHVERQKGTGWHFFFGIGKWGSGRWCFKGEIWWNFYGWVMLGLALGLHGWLCKIHWNQSPSRLRVTIFIASKTAIAPPGSQPYLTGSLSVASPPGQRCDGFQPIPKAILVMTRAGTVLGTYPQFAGGCIPTWNSEIWRTMKLHDRLYEYP